MNLFKEKTGEKDVKMVRETLLQFIKQQLGKLEGGEGAHIKGLHLFIAAAPEERHIYESAVYFEEPGRFRNEEVQRVADDYAIDLPAGWEMETSFADAIPAEAIKISGLEAGLFIRTQKSGIGKPATAYLRVLNGEAEKEFYTIHSTDGKITLGREKRVQAGDGFFRINTIAFPAESQQEANKYISRQHAHIEYDKDAGQFYLYADEGGIPPRNKIKVRSVSDDTPVKLYSTQIGHALKEGDQVMLGESAILEFSYSEQT
jgi:hypothetical protein